MKPHSIGTISLEPPVLSPADKAILQEKGFLPKPRRTAAFKGEVLPETQVPACPRVKVADLPEGHLKQKWIDQLEQNQKILSCCRHPENHEVEARKSHPDEKAPDIYIFHCTCGRKHRFFCVGQIDHRPVWDAA